MTKDEFDLYFNKHYKDLRKKTNYTLKSRGNETQTDEAVTTIYLHLINKQLDKIQSEEDVKRFFIQTLNIASKFKQNTILTKNYSKYKPNYTTMESITLDNFLTTKDEESFYYNELFNEYLIQLQNHYSKTKSITTFNKILIFKQLLLDKSLEDIKTMYNWSSTGNVRFYKNKIKNDIIKLLIMN